MYLKLYFNIFYLLIREKNQTNLKSKKISFSSKTPIIDGIRYYPKYHFVLVRRTGVC